MQSSSLRPPTKERRNGNTTEEVLSWLRDDEGAVSVSDCLIMLMDPGSLPGVAILNSSVERLPVVVNGRSSAQPPVEPMQFEHVSES